MKIRNGQPSIISLPKALSLLFPQFQMIKHVCKVLEAGKGTLIVQGGESGIGNRKKGCLKCWDPDCL